MPIYLAIDCGSEDGRSSVKSVHRTLHGAIKALYPEKDYKFMQYDATTWIGPDGFGRVEMRKVEE